MCDKVIILGWHFDTENKTNIDLKGNWSTIDNSNGKIFQFNSKKDFTTIDGKYKLYLISCAKEAFKNDEGIVNKRIKKIIDGNQGKEILLLLHKEPWEDGDYTSEDKLIVDVFSGGPLYCDQDNPKGILNEQENLLLNPIPDCKWNFIWNELYIALSQKKNKLIKLWLPLAIDIQGLSEVNDKTGYLDEVEEAWKEEDFDKLFDKHNNIIDNIEDKNISEFKIEENGGIYKNIYKLKNIKENIDELIDSNQDYFLPNYLHKLIETTDTIIEKQNN